MRISELNHGSSKSLIWSRLDDTYLFLLRSDLVDRPLQWDLPGGHVEPGEKHITALRRELTEEMDWELGSAPYTVLSKRITQEPRFVAVDYAICVPQQFTPSLDWENVDHKWCALDSMPEPVTWNVNMLISNDSAAERLRLFQKRCRELG
jgi:8-oxo-dGTP pyrophosphatase MutT (NUDIX family)